MFFFKRRFYIISIVFLLSVPFLFNIDLLIGGEFTKGKVVSRSSCFGRRGERFMLSIFQFEADSSYYKIIGPLDYKLTIGTPRYVIYQKDNPLNCLVLDILFIYAGKRYMIYVYIICLFWSVAFFSIRKELIKSKEENRVQERHYVSRKKNRH